MNELDRASKKNQRKTTKETRCTRTKDPLDKKEKHLYAVFNPLTLSAHYITYHHVRHNAINCLSLLFVQLMSFVGICILSARAHANPQGVRVCECVFVR